MFMIDLNIKVSYRNQLNNDGTMDLVLTSQTVFVKPTGSVIKTWFWITILNHTIAVDAYC